MASSSAASSTRSWPARPAPSRRTAGASRAPPQAARRPPCRPTPASTSRAVKAFPISCPDAECRRALDAALAAAGAPPEGTLTLTLSDDAELAALNAEHMGKDGPTDVLSFPLLPPTPFRRTPARTRRSRRPGRARLRAAARRAGPPRRHHRLRRARPAQADEGRGGQTGDVRLEPGRRAAPADHPRRAAPLRLGPRRAREEAAMRALERRLLGLADRGRVRPGRRRSGPVEAPTGSLKLNVNRARPGARRPPARRRGGPPAGARWRGRGRRRPSNGAGLARARTARRSAPAPRPGCPGPGRAPDVALPGAAVHEARAPPRRPAANA